MNVIAYEQYIPDYLAYFHIKLLRMATANSDVDFIADGYDTLSRDIERYFDKCLIILETRKNLLLEKVRQMKELYQKHQNITKGIEQIESVKENTNKVITQNSIAGNKDLVLSIWDEKIKDFDNEKLKLDRYRELVFVPNLAEFEQCVNKCHLNECGVMEFCKRREPCVMKRFGNVESGRNVMGSGLAVDTDTDLLYVCDYCRNSVCIFSKEGEFVNSFGEGKMNGPHDLSLSAEFLFVTDEVSIVKFSKSGEYSNTFKTSIFMFAPMGLCISSQSQLVYVCNYALDRVEVFDLDLHYNKCFGQEKLLLPVDVDIYETKIYVITHADTPINVFDSNHNTLHSIALPGLVSNELLSFFKIDLSGNFVISDRGAHCLVVYTATGGLLGSLGDGYLISPRGIGTNRNNRIIVISEGYNSLQLY